MESEPNGESTGTVAEVPPEQPAATTAPAEQPPQQDQPAATDWRKELAGDNQEISKLLERYKTPTDAAKAHLEAVKKIRIGNKAAPPPGPEASAEDLAKWRADAGIPADPTGYDLELGNGLVIGEADKPVVDDWLKYAHKNNMKPADVKAAVAYMIERQGQTMAAMKAETDKASVEAINRLKSEYGDAGFNEMLEVRKVFMESLPDSVRTSLEHAVLPNGMPIGADYDVFLWLHDQAISSGYNDKIAPKGGSGVQSISDQLMELNKKFAGMPNGSEKNAVWKKIETLQQQKIARQGVVKR